MREFMEIEFSTRHVAFFVFLLLIILVVIFFFGFHQGRRFERMHAKENTVLQRGIEDENPAGGKETLTPPEEETIPTEKVEPLKNAAVFSEEKQESSEEDKPTLLAENRTLYFVQVGAFRNREYAVATLQRFQQRGYDSSLFEPEKNFLFYRVVVGGYATEDEALRVKNVLEEEDRARYYVIQHGKK